MLKVLPLFFFFLFASVQILADLPSQAPAVKIEFTQQQADSVSAPSIVFQLNDFPQKERIIFSVFRPLTEKQQILSTFIVNDKEITQIGQTQEECIPLSEIDFFKGERVIFCFQTTDKVLVELSMIPCPMRAKNKTGDIEISAELTHHDDSIYRVRLTGINNGENFILYSRSEDEVNRTRGKFSNTNPMIFLPHVVGKKGGTCTVTFKIIGQEISIDLPWGNSVASSFANITLKNANPKLSFSRNQNYFNKIKNKSNNKFAINPFIGTKSSTVETHYNNKNSYEEAYRKNLLLKESSADWNIFTGNLGSN